MSNLNVFLQIHSFDQEIPLCILEIIAPEIVKDGQTDEDNFMKILDWFDIWIILLNTNGTLFLNSDLAVYQSHVNDMAVARTLIGGCLFIYSCSARLVSFEIKFKFMSLKRN